jgi:hypothetical protein
LKKPKIEIPKWVEPLVDLWVHYGLGSKRRAMAQVEESIEEQMEKEAEMTKEESDYERQAEEIDNWFVYHPPKQGDIVKFAQLRIAGKELALTIAQCCPPSADRSAAIRQVRQAIMTANASIACHKETT